MSTGVWIPLTVGVWLVSVRLAQQLPSNLSGQSIVLGIIGICAILAVFDVEPATYLHAVQPITYLVGLATVSLALPLWGQRKLIRDNAFVMLTATVVATLTGMGTAWLCGKMLGLTAPELASIAPKMTTLAVALPLSKSTGGWEDLTMLAVMFNGIGGAAISQAIWHVFARKSDEEDRAFTLGATSHAMGIARTTIASPDTVAFASCGMLLSAIVTTILYGLGRTVLATQF